MSSLDFAAGEILELAEEIERNGAAFYRRAAALATDDGSRRLLEDLASSEEEHERTFRGLRASLDAGPSSRSPTLDPDEQATLYLRAFASRNVFDARVPPEELLDDDVSDEEVYRIALGMEKDSIALYAGLRSATTNAAARDAVDAILREEMTHVTVLADALARTLR